MPDTPVIVDRAAWQQARADLLVEEKAATRALDALAARRRRLPMVTVDPGHRFTGPDGELPWTDLFDGRSELVVYQFMDRGPDELCYGCVTMMDNVGRLEHLQARGVSWATVSNMPFEQLAATADRFGWRFPYYSSRGTTFSDECGAGDNFGISAFLRTDDGVFQTYFTTDRGADRLRFDFNVLDLAVYGRQETWEDSPAGWPQSDPYAWWRPRDEYGVTG